VQTAEFENPDYLSNPANRCYFCKHELFEQLAPIARAEKFAVIAYGENASDTAISVRARRRRRNFRCARRSRKPV
jgi:PP-loop superfamily ATP-utilizing enzyme